MTARQCDQTRWAWCNGYDEAVEDEAARHCRRVLHPNGDDRDVSHLHPDRVRLGGQGVFARDWAWTPNPDGDLRIPVGFAGTLVDRWNGWAVFTCTREVAEAIVADQQEACGRYRRQLAADGIGERGEQMVDDSWRGCGSTVTSSSSTRRGCTTTRAPSTASSRTGRAAAS
ncbi:hypothetical protein M8C17_01140 [Micromonospora sp. RHAY321]|uniref:hypothetical protein n=1 Tax=unclassified Micromonospora TaxID=2617518 RepID=UPI00207C8B92|nr:hypothetical protein [Micromonospora sp. RHAY321]MCO1593766.1 hypothetical protein [Micromonospora sp. RHAY321]